MKLKTYLTKHGASKAMAEQLGIHHVYMNALVNNRRRPSPRLALRISEATGGAVSVMELLFPDGQAS